MTWKITGAPGTGDNLLYSQADTPTLDLRFASTKRLTDYVSGKNLINFTRASNATYVDSQGIIRTAVTNLLLRSEDFSTTWTTNGTCSVSTDQAVAPNGTLTADEITVNNGLVNHVAQSASVTSGTVYTLSVYVKAGTITTISFRAAIVGNDGYIVYTFATDSISIATPTFISSANSVSLGNGWYRLSMQYTPTVSGTASIRIGGGNTNDGTCYIWGAQLEQSSTVGEYIPTTSTINSAPRFDHNPLTGESLGLLVEEQRTNLLLQSEDFSTTWFAARLTLDTDAVASPDGSISADKIIPDIEDSPSHYMRQLDASTLDNTTFTFSVYAKAGELSFVRLQPVLRDVSQPNSSFNLSTGEIRSGAGLTTGRAYLGNGWYRLWVTFNSGTGSFGIQPRIFVDVDLTGLTSFIGDGTSGLYIWGAQLEVGDFPTSYIPTTTAAATRTADVASITGTNFSSWYRQDEGTVFAAWLANGTNQYANVYNFHANTGFSNIWQLYRNNSETGVVGKIRDTTGSQDIIAAAISAWKNTANVSAHALQLNNAALCVNGGSVGVDSSVALPNLDRLNLGTNQNFGNTAYLNGTIRRLAYWPQRLGNEVLQTITQ
jgi:hypothetical protein